MSAFQGVRLAANLGQQNLSQQMQLDAHLGRRSDEMWSRYFQEKSLVARQAEQIFYPTMEKLFSQAVEAGPVGEFLSKLVGESRVRVGESVRNAEMDAQKRIQQRMIDEAVQGSPMMTIGGTTGVAPEVGDKSEPGIGEPGSPHAGPPAPKSGSGDLPPSTAPAASNVRIPEGATPQQAQAIQSVANRASSPAPANQRFQYDIPGVELYANPYGDGVVARFKNGKTTMFSHDDIDAIRGAIKAENAAIIADGIAAASSNAFRQQESDNVFEENFNYIMGSKAIDQALEAGVITPDQAALMVRHGIVPTADDWKDLAQNHITYEGMIDTVRDRVRTHTESVIDQNIKDNSAQIKRLESQLSSESSGEGGALSGEYKVGAAPSPSAGAAETNRKSRVQDQLNYLRAQSRKLAVRRRSLYNHNIHGDNPSLGGYANDGNLQVDVSSMNDLMMLTATRLTGSTNPEDAMRLLPHVVADTDQFLNTFMPALQEEARSNGWSVDGEDAPDALWWAKNYITHVGRSVDIENVRRDLIERDESHRQTLAHEPDLTVADDEYVSGFRRSMDPSSAPAPAQESPAGPSPEDQQAPVAIDPEVGLTQDQISAFATHLGWSTSQARDYLRIFKGRERLTDEDMQRYVSNIVGDVQEAAPVSDQETYPVGTGQNPYKND